MCRSLGPGRQRVLESGGRARRARSDSASLAPRRRTVSLRPAPRPRPEPHHSTKVFVSVRNPAINSGTPWQTGASPYPTSNSHLTSFSNIQIPNSSTSSFPTPQLSLPNFQTSIIPIFAISQPTPVNLHRPTLPLLSPPLIFISIKSQQRGEVWRGGVSATTQKT